MRIMRGRRFVAAASLALAAWTVSAQPRAYSPAELGRDLDQFRRIVERKAVGLYADRPALAEALDKAEEAIARGPMGELEFFRLLAPALAALRCGHSFLDPSRAAETAMREGGRFFPLEVRSLEGRLFVIADPYGRGVPLGSELLSIGGESASLVFERIASGLSTDGRDRGRPRYDAERWFAAMHYLQVGEAESFEIEYLPPSGLGGPQAPLRASLAPARDPALAKIPSGIIFDTLGSKPEAEFREGYAYLRVPVFSTEDGAAYEAFLSGFFAELRGRGTETLVLDLRGNYGGTPAPTAALFRYLIDRPLPFFGPGHLLLLPWRLPQKPARDRFAGRLYVLMDEAAFSMNGFLLALIKHHGIGTLVGAPSSGGYRCSDSSVSEVLKETGIRVRYSTAVYEVAVKDMEEGLGVSPDLLSRPTLADYLEGRDWALEAALTAAGLDP